MVPNDPENLTEERVTRFLSTIEERVFRLPPHCLATIRILAAGKDHPSGGEVYQEVSARFPTTGIATAYEILWEFDLNTFHLDAPTAIGMVAEKLATEKRRVT